MPSMDSHTWQLQDGLVHLAVPEAPPPGAPVPDPTVTVNVPKASALRFLVSPDLMKLGQAYVEGHIDFDGHASRAVRQQAQLCGIAEDQLKPLAQSR